MTERDSLRDLERRAEEASVAYEKNEALRAFVNVIPGIGGGLDVLLASGGQRSRTRMIRFISDLQEDMKGRLEVIEDSLVDQDYLQSDEFFDLLLKAFDTSAKTRDEEKRRVCARILVESAILSKRQGYSPEEYLDIVAGLTPRELAVAREFYEYWPKEKPSEPEDNADVQEHKDVQKQARKDWQAWQDMACKGVGIDGTDLQLILGRLQSVGLMTADIGDFSIDGGPITETPRHWATPAFEKLMGFLERREWTYFSLFTQLPTSLILGKPIYENLNRSPRWRLHEAFTVS